MPAGSYTSSTSITDANNLARQEAQRRANVSGGCTTIYVRLVKENEVIDNGTWGTADFYFRFYSDGAGTVRVPLPTDVVINWRWHFYWTDNGGPPYGEGYDNFIIQAYTGMDEVSLKDFEILDCGPAACRHFEPILNTGRYVIIP
jgi:hypothetical protein